MDVIPAVDIMNGKVVRLPKGDPKSAVSYAHLGDPLTLAKRWEAEGAQIVHIVDLDAALGQGSNMKVIEEIVEALTISAQVGGGIRSLSAARALLNKGVGRVILGSLGFEDPSAVKALLNEFSDARVIVALDNLGGIVMVRGWRASSGITVDEAFEKFQKLGVKLFFVTSVEHDGTLSGPDLATLGRLCERGVSVISAGGVGGLDDLVALKRLGVRGVVVGKALYDGVFSLGKALRSVGEE